MIPSIRYVERNPVRAGLGGRARDWSTAEARTGGADIHLGLVDIREIVEMGPSEGEGYLDAQEKEPELIEKVRNL